MKMRMDYSLGKATLLAGLCLATTLITTASRVLSQGNFVVTIEPPGVANQESPLVVRGVDYGAEGVHEEDFNRMGVAPGGTGNQVLVRQVINFSNDSALGSYSPTVVRTADVFGGANGTAYMTVNPTLRTTIGGTAENGIREVTINFNQEQRYFGLWWSAGDPHNVLEFFEHGHLVFDFTTSKVVNFIETSLTISADKRAEYFGNPNSQFNTSSGTRGNIEEPYAFLNFFADPLHPTVTFDKIILTNDAISGFESDNHTIAAAYKSISGEQIPLPEAFPEDVEVDEEISVGPGGVLTPPKLEIHPGGTVEIDDGGEVVVDDSFKEDPGGHLRITVGGPDCPDSGKLLVGGHATIEGDLTLASFHNFRPSAGQHWTILVANGGLSGTFSQIIDTLNTSGLTRADIYAPNGFVTAYLPSGHGVLTLRSAIPIPFNDICDVSAVLVNALAPNANQLGAPFDIWFSLAQQQRFNLQNHFDDIMAAPVPAIPTPPPPSKEVVGKGVVTGKGPLPPSPVTERRWNLWASGYGSWQDLSSEGMAKGYNYTIGGVTAGARYCQKLCIRGAHPRFFWVTG
jgi:hypothetical protein